MCIMTLNADLRGVELYFENKPERSILDGLKAVGYHWHNIKKCWYAKQNAQTMELAKMLSEEEQKQPEPITIEAHDVKQVKTEGYFPPYESIGNEKIFRDSSAISIMGERGGYFADICALMWFYSGQVRITDLSNALLTGKTCKSVTLDFHDNMPPTCEVFNTGAHTFKDVYQRYFIGKETDGATRYESEQKSIETFSPFRQIKPIKTPSKWTISHVWKAILSGQIYSGKVDGRYSDDYAYDNATNFSEGRGIDLISFAAKLIDSKSGWDVRPVNQDGSKVTLSVNCYSFNMNTFYYDESCNLEEGKRRRAQAARELEERNAAQLAQVVELNPDELPKDQIYDVTYIEMDGNTGEYARRRESLQWHEIFWADTIWEGNNEREEIENRHKVIKCEPINIDSREIFEVANTFDRYNGNDPRVIRSSCFMAYVTGYALREMLQEGKHLPMIKRNKMTYEALEREIRLHYKPSVEGGFTVSMHSLFNVGTPENYQEEHMRLLAEWNRIPE